MLKLIYLARRKPDFTFDEFVCRWRMHGALAMSKPLWRFAVGYVQAEPIRPAPIAGASEEYDAVACYMVRDEMFKEMGPDDGPGAMAMAADELETFSAPIPTTSLWVDEEPVREGELGGIAAYLFCSSEETARALAEQARGEGGLDRIILNVATSEGALGPGSNTLPYAAVVELSARDVPTLAKAVGSGADGLVSRADVAVVTRDVVLWNRLSG